MDRKKRVVVSKTKEEDEEESSIDKKKSRTEKTRKKWGNGEFSDTINKQDREREVHKARKLKINENNASKMTGLVMNKQDRETYRILDVREIGRKY